MLSDDEIYECVEWYDENFELYEKLSKKVEDILHDIIKERKMNVHNITPRTKKREDFYKKI